MKKLIIVGAIPLMLLAGCRDTENSIKEDCVEVKETKLGNSSASTAILVYSKENGNEYQLASNPSRVTSMRKGNIMKVKYNKKMRLREFNFVKSCKDE